MGRDYIVFIRGLPWSVNPEQVLKFLEGIVWSKRIRLAKLLVKVYKENLCFFNRVNIIGLLCRLQCARWG